MSRKYKTIMNNLNCFIKANNDFEGFKNGKVFLTLLLQADDNNLVKDMSYTGFAEVAKCSKGYVKQVLDNLKNNGLIKVFKGANTNTYDISDFIGIEKDERANYAK